MNLCSDSSKCKKFQVPKTLEEKLNKCNFEGKLASDPDSIVNLVNCNDDTMDISVMSSKVEYEIIETTVLMLQANLSQIVYRKLKDGDVTIPKVGFSDEIKIKPPEGNDYAMFEQEGQSKSPKNFLSYVDKKGHTVAFMRDPKNKKCCYPVKMKCKGKSSSNRKDVKCKAKKAKPCGKGCGGQDKCNCKTLKTFILKQKKKALIKKVKKVQKKKKRKNGKRKQREKPRKKQQKRPNLGNKVLQKLSKKDLQNLLRTLELQSSEKNPKCQPSRNFKTQNREYQTKQVIMLGCPQPCRKKDDIPYQKQYKIYNQRTIEIGVFADKHLYKLIAVRFSF